MEYTFEKVIGESNNVLYQYQVRLNGEFVCWANHTNSQLVDNYLKREGYNSREEFF